MSKSSKSVAIKQQAVSLGEIQSQVEAATKEYKAAQSNLVRASERVQKAEQEYANAVKTLNSGYAAVRASNALPLV